MKSYFVLLVSVARNLTLPFLFASLHFLWQSSFA
uniref:Chitinase homolog LP6 (lp6) protein n=1 Tax=Pinus taeda TaxID=3352 RepID=V9H024_PINTA|nr:hypothetical protein c2 - loblolly pine [Pinus taeda]AAA75096.1 uORFc2; Method: conceptual translation supplied by author [Pinus taeda]